MTDRIMTLLERISQLENVSPEDRRRERLIERAVAAGHSWEYADRIYDVACEENVEPVVAFELLLTGVGVRELASSPVDSREEAQVEAPPAWVGQETLAPAEAARERRLRTTLRRVRAITEQHSSVEDSVRAFVREPDVGDVDY